MGVIVQLNNDIPFAFLFYMVVYSSVKLFGFARYTKRPFMLDRDRICDFRHH
jgi:hypothetical protein